MTTETPGVHHPGEAPLVSVVMATYNRSNILGFAIESVRWQLLTNWELLVTGDACTDETAAVVASFDDPRIRFHNLAVNVGEQSGPNNEGTTRARGRYVAYLNHDDLWLPDHLETMVQALGSLGADLVWPAALRLLPKGDFDCMVWPVNTTRGFRADMVVPASLWVFRRELLAAVGPWRGYRECYGAPSQDWLFRAARAGARLYHVPCITAIKCRGDHNSYADRASDANRALFERIKREPDFRERIVTSLMLEYRLRASAVGPDGPGTDG